MTDDLQVGGKSHIRIAQWNPNAPKCAAAHCDRPPYCDGLCKRHDDERLYREQQRKLRVLKSGSRVRVDVGLDYLVAGSLTKDPFEILRQWHVEVLFDGMGSSRTVKLKNVMMNRA